MLSSPPAHLRTPLPSCFRNLHLDQPYGVTPLIDVPSMEKEGLVGRKPSLVQSIRTRANRSRSVIANSPSLRAPNSPALGCHVGCVFRYEDGTARRRPMKTSATIRPPIGRRPRPRVLFSASLSP